MSKEAKELVVLNRCKAQLATIKDLPTLLEIRDKAKAIADYNKARKAGFEAANYGKSIVALAEARSGQVLKKMQAAGERDAGKGGNRRSRSQVLTVKLDESQQSDSGSQHANWRMSNYK